MAALAWMFSEWLVHGKPSLLGIASGAVAGLVAITPACGFVDPKGALVIGAAAGVGCYICSTGLKKMLGYDDSLDVFGVHGVGGIIGAILTGVFAVEAFGGKAGLLEGNFAQVPIQVYGVLATIAWSCRRHLRDPDHPEVHDRHSRQRGRRGRRSRRRAARRVRSVSHTAGRGPVHPARGPHTSPERAPSPRRALNSARCFGISGRFFCARSGQAGMLTRVPGRTACSRRSRCGPRQGDASLGRLQPRARRRA